MNSDDFETRLQKQTFRDIPANWREEVLNAANLKPTRHVATRSTWWRELFWPCPQAWAGLAAVWLVIIFVNFSTREESAVVAQNNSIQSPESLMALKQREWIVAELKDTNEATVADRPKQLQPRPRSELRDEVSFA